MNTVYLLLGSNLGDSKSQLSLATQAIEVAIGKVSRKSSFYKTAAWGMEDQPDFLNQILMVESNLYAKIILEKVLHIEEKLGRIRNIKNAARIIDIDILFYNKEVIHTKNLTVPHPEIVNRRFVLQPLAELSPDFVHPVLHESITQLLAACKDNLNVQKI